MQILQNNNSGEMELIMKRREFLKFFLLGGIFSILAKKAKAEERPKRAIFWKKVK